jgi:hypothetical protein
MAADRIGITTNPISPFSGQLLKEIRKKHLLEVKMFGKMPTWNFGLS